MKKIAALIVVLALAGAGAWYQFADKKTPEEQYRFAKVERGDLESIVSSTGTLSAVSMVQVGTQVSGTISKILVDFNQRVRQGELIALIDTTFLAASVRDAESNLERARAQLDHARREHRRIQALFEKNMAASSDLEQSQYNLDLAGTGLKSSQAALDRARINLKYASIYAPIDGTVINRPVDEGQTVAASFSAPILFLIANDLSRMQILANVDESDIGQIKEGQEARFTVQAFPGRTFQGRVSQVRLQPTTIQNVVNYTVVVEVANEEGLLLPGMTATVDFLIEQAEDIFKVPNAALRFRPTPQMLAEFRKRLEQQQGGEGNRTWGQAGAEQGGEGNRAARPDREGGGGWGGGAGRQDMGRLWRLDEQGQLQVVRVRTGISDGQMTEINADEISEGLEVISGVLTPGANPTPAGTFMPFPGAAPAGRGPGGGGGRRGGAPF